MVEVKERPKARGERTDGMAHTIRKIGVVGAGPDGQRHRPCLRALRLSCAAQRRRRRPHHGRASPLSTAIWHVRSAGSASATSSGRRPSSASRPPRRSRTSAMRSGDRGCDREGGRQAQDLQCAVSGAQARNDRRHQHLLDLHHAARRLDRPAGTFHRHSFHESGAADGAGRGDPRHRHRRRHVRVHQAVHRQARQDRSRCRRISPPSSSTASCCR